MGVMKELKNGKSAVRKAKSDGKVPSFFTWKPNEAEIDELQDFVKDPAEAVAELGSALRPGLVLKLGYREDSGSFYATLFEHVEWPSPSKGLSVWHSDPTKAFLGLLFAATRIYPDFPDRDWPPAKQLSFW